MTPHDTGPAGAPPRLALRDITVRFGGLTALESVSVTVPAGSVVGIMGPNGAGKTTLFNVVCGVYKPTSGSVEIDGRAVRPRTHNLTGLGISRSLQGLGLFGGQSVLDNVVAGLQVETKHSFFEELLALPRATRSEREKKERAMATLASLGIDAYAAALPDTLPYAIRKKVSIARALVSKPSLLLLDEPAGGLGHEEIEELATLIRSIPGNGCSVVLVEHHVDLVMSVCDSIAVLDFGKLIAQGTPAEVSANPAVTEAYLGVDAA
ncbi:ABC transporter ATP-binding protein [Salinibacterium sp. SYSU T00001]|uniref:ABC transporter ATP-binding protein n=1 Tax=Homoserinimonas sedimenticola TaxID=2986805 RepID=UPI0022366D4F|nr:ABC transporter ATP-binding protein [Salinibacterium sedimenticola]MCW4386080.1 ABC transporter ATP-binding protein [Salinibacterium sedimenticola]